MKKPNGKEYNMKEEGQNKVIRPFINNNIELHIDARYTPTNQRLVCILENKFSTDDGCMGGGEAIDYVNPIHKDTIYNTYYNDPSKFNSNRKICFHYCVIADTQEGNSDATGNGKYKNNRFILFDGNLGSSKKQAKCFLHELGHNLMGTHDDPSDPWYNPDATHLEDTANYGRRDHCTDSDCALVRGHYNWNPPLDYCDKCWNDLRLDWCF